MLLRHVFILASLISFQSVIAEYRLLQDYSGDAFYQSFEFFTDADPTDGHVVFQSMEAANNSGIAGFLVSDNADRAVYLGVDSTDTAPNGRGAVRVTSTESFNHGLVIADILHMPGGICGTWPAFWMVGPEWPSNGEIDIVEGVNDQITNSMTLHTGSGPVVNNGTNFLGELVTADCDVNAVNQPTNAGCSIGDVSNLTFGNDFNTAGGGVYATEWTSDFIKIWFFPRGSFPADIASSKPNPSNSWGPPNSLFQGEFNIDDYFKNLQIVFDTTFCGQVRGYSRHINEEVANHTEQWAGDAWKQSSCASLAPTCEEYVTNNPSAFEEAYWAINTLQVFEDDGVETNVTSTPHRHARRHGRKI